MAPSRPRPPAVTAVSVLRVKELAPVAARVRRSPAVSLRMRPTDMPNMPRASATPNNVAQLMISLDDGALFLVSRLMLAWDAATRALVIWVGVIGALVWIIQPATLDCRWYLWMAYS